MDVNNVGAAAQAATNSTEAAKKPSQVQGRTVGKPQLSEAGLKYYNELKSKYKDMDFVLVSKDMKQQAAASAGSFANASKTVVLIDEEKIEKMATDEEYRKKYEGIIDNAKKQIPQLEQALKNTPGVKGFGMQVNDNGTTSFFAVMEKGNKAQAERISKKRAEKKAEKKAADKKAEKKDREEKISEKRAKSKEAKLKEADTSETLTASTVEDLIARINEFAFSNRADSVMTEQESMLGSHVDFSG